MQLIHRRLLLVCAHNWQGDRDDDDKNSNRNKQQELQPSSSNAAADMDAPRLLLFLFLNHETLKLVLLLGPNLPDWTSFP